jgi:transcriptional regulator with XRE-family HTH domain
MKIGSNLRAMREKSGLDRKDVAKYLGVSTSTVGHWENDDNEPGLTHLERLSKLYKVQICDLFGEECNTPAQEELKNTMLDKVIDLLHDEGLLVNVSAYEDLDENSKTIVKSVVSQLIAKKKQNA